MKGSFILALEDPLTGDNFGERKRISANGCLFSTRAEAIQTFSPSLWQVY